MLLNKEADRTVIHSPLGYQPEKQHFTSKLKIPFNKPAHCLLWKSFSESVSR